MEQRPPWDWQDYEGISDAGATTVTEGPQLTVGDDAPPFNFAGPVDGWIRDHASGGTFCDIGGIGLHAQNERITAAAHAGATSATMIDYRRADFDEWGSFASKMTERRIAGYRVIDGVNLEDRDFPAQVGTYDFVHCTGILYHAPSPMLMLENLARITRRWLVTNTVVIPDQIDNAAGSLSFPGSQAVFLPGLSEDERAVLEVHYQQALGWPEGRFSAFAPRIGDERAAMPWMQTRAASAAHFWGERGALSYSPYWWLFTRQAFRAAVGLLGFAVTDEASFKGHTLTLLCERESDADGR